MEDQINKPSSEVIFANTLNKFAVYIIVSSITVLLSLLLIFSFKSLTNKKVNYINFKLDNVKIEKYDSTIVKINTKFIKDFNENIDSFKIQIEEVKKIKNEIDEAQKKNEDYFKLILALIGSVFAIVGFFGFKSISDTRQATLDAAKIKAETIAKEIAERKSKDISEDYIKNYIKGEEVNKIVTDFASSKAEEISYRESKTIATNTAKDLVGSYLNDQKEQIKANSQEVIELKKELKEELTELRKDYYFLMTFIRSLNLRARSNPNSHDDSELDAGLEPEINNDDKPII